MLPDHVTTEVQRRLDYALSLAERGAVLSARSEAMDALRLIGRSLDADRRTVPRSQSIERALAALFDEAAPNPKAVQDRYHSATETLTTAFDHQPIASKALCTLGRLQTMPRAALEQEDDRRFTGPRSMALHLAAVRVDPANTEAAHELGTLFAQYGQLDQAVYWLRRSTVNSIHPESWDNLATVLDQQGRTADARTARARARELEIAAKPAVANDRPAVNWVDPAAFSQVGGSDVAGSGPVQPALGQVPVVETPAATEKPRAAWPRRLFPGSRKP